MSFTGNSPSPNERPIVTLLGSIGAVVFGVVMVCGGVALVAAVYVNLTLTGLVFAASVLVGGMVCSWVGLRWMFKSIIALIRGDARVDDP